MANRLTDINFIDSNPAIDEMRTNRDFQQRQALGAADLQGKQLANDFNSSANPIRLNKLGAETTTAESQANVDSSTQGDKIAKSGADATVATNDATVSTASVPAKSKMAEQTLRQQTATAASTEMNTVKSALDRVDGGDAEGGKEMWRSLGLGEMPNHLIQSAQERAIMKGAIETSRRTQPDHPRGGQQVVQGIYDQIEKDKAEGRVTPFVQQYLVPPGAPEPVENSGSSQYDLVHRQELDPTTGQPVVKSYKFDRKSGDMTQVEGTGAFGKAGSAAGGNPTALQKNAEFYVKSGVAPDLQSAIKMMREGVNNPTFFGRMVQGEKKLLMTTNPNMKEVDAERLAQQRVKDRAAGKEVVDPPAPPKKPGMFDGLFGGGSSAPTPAPQSQAPGSGLPPANTVTGVDVQNTPSGLGGVGTRQSPYQASTQDHVDWFKQTAAPGSIIVVDGKMYTK